METRKRELSLRDNDPGPLRARVRERAKKERIAELKYGVVRLWKESAVDGIDPDSERSHYLDSLGCSTFGLAREREPRRYAAGVSTASEAGWIDIFATLDTIQSWYVCTYVSDYLKSKNLWCNQIPHSSHSFSLEILRMKECPDNLEVGYLITPFIEDEQQGEIPFCNIKSFLEGKMGQ